MYRPPVSINGLIRIELIMKDGLIEEMPPRHSADCEDLVDRTLNMYQDDYEAGSINTVVVYDDNDSAKIVPGEDFFCDSPTWELTNNTIGTVRLSTIADQGGKVHA